MLALVKQLGLHKQPHRFGLMFWNDQRRRSSPLLRLGAWPFKSVTKSAFETFGRSISRIVGIYKPTAKNGLVKELYGQMGFRRAGEDANEVRYELDVPSMPVIKATHVRNASATSS